jgi:hypothetical protein
MGAVEGLERIRMGTKEKQKPTSKVCRPEKGWQRREERFEIIRLPWLKGAKCPCDPVRRAQQITK